MFYHFNTSISCLFNPKEICQDEEIVFLFACINGKNIKTLAFDFNKLALESKLDLL